MQYRSLIVYFLHIRTQIGIAYGQVVVERHRKLICYLLQYVVCLAIDVDSHDIQLLANLYWKQKAAVRKISEWRSVKQGVRQVCVASPYLFAMYTEMIMKSLEDKEASE